MRKSGEDGLTDVSVRRADAGDLSALSDLEARLFSTPWTRSQIEGHLSADYTLSLLLSEGEEPVGYLFAGFTPPEGELYRIAVLPEKRRRGYARHLIDAFFREAEGREVYSLFLEVRESNAAAISLYRSAGFREFFLREDYYRDPREAALVMTIGRPKEF